MPLTNPFSLDGRLALITGSSTGIGLAVARALGNAGATLVLNGRDAGKLGSAATALRAEGLQVHTRGFDVTDAQAVHAAVANIEQELGAIEVLVNNAGMAMRATLQDITQADYQRVMRTNLDSAFYVGQAVARPMIARGRGHIINMCSVMSEVARGGAGAYAVSKGGLKMLTKAMCADWAPLGLNVNGIGPGYFKTDLTQALAANPEFTTWLVARTPARRWGELEDLGGAAVFLASDASRFVNGHVLYVDGGFTASA